MLCSEPQEGPAGGPESAEAGEQNGKGVGVGEANATSATPVSGHSGWRSWCPSTLDTHPPHLLVNKNYDTASMGQNRVLWKHTGDPPSQGEGKEDTQTSEV